MKIESGTIITNVLVITVSVSGANAKSPFFTEIQKVEAIRIEKQY